CLWYAEPPAAGPLCSRRRSRFRHALAMAMVQDLFTGKKAQGRLAVITVVTNVAPMIAPALGAALLSHMGWRAIYLATGLCGVILLLAILFSLRETAVRQHSEREPFLTVMPRAYRRVL